MTTVFSGQDTRAKCVFCSVIIDPGSDEHVFPSSIGGRIVTSKAICLECNNAFANKSTDKIDDELSENFKQIRNGLKIWSGRKNPPPIIENAGAMADGSKFDLVAGFTPVMKIGQLPKHMETGQTYQIAARDEADAERLKSIMEKRGYSYQTSGAVRVQQKVPTVRLSMKSDGKKLLKSVSKTAITSFIVLYGNSNANSLISRDLRNAVRYNSFDIFSFAGWDFTNEWPDTQFSAHHRSPDASTSGFDHSVVIADVEQFSVGYITIFGHFRFSVRFGPATGLPIRGLGVNPRSTTPARFIVSAKAPSSYAAKGQNSFRDEYNEIMAGAGGAFNAACEQWSKEAEEENAQNWTNELNRAIIEAGTDETARIAAIESFFEKLATVEHGGAWKTELDMKLMEDDAG